MIPRRDHDQVQRSLLDERGVVGLRILTGSVSYISQSMFPCAMRAAIDLLACRDAVSDDPALAMSTDWRHVVDGAFEAIVRGALPASYDFK